jgi:hypothetical protein
MSTVFRIDEVAPGACGLLVDEIPLLTVAHVKPYIVAILLHRGAVRRHEVVASLVSHCNQLDLKVGGWDPMEDDYCEDTTRMEKIIDESIGEFVSEKLLRYNEEQDIWVLTADCLPTIVSWVTSLGAKLPQHLSYELSRQQANRIPEYIEYHSV